MKFIYLLFCIILSFTIYSRLQNTNKKSIQDNPLLTNKLVFYLLCVLTSGFWIIAWAAYAWDDIEKIKKSRITPFWRAIFWYFQNHSLLNSLLDIAGEKREDMAMFVGIFSPIAYIISISLAGSKSLTSIYISIVFILLLPFLFFPAISARNKIIKIKNKSFEPKNHTEEEQSLKVNKEIKIEENKMGKVERTLWLTLVFIFVLVLLAGTFFWFQWRPSQIKKYCINKWEYNRSYNVCLHKHGM